MLDYLSAVLHKQTPTTRADIALQGFETPKKEEKKNTKMMKRKKITSKRNENLKNQSEMTAEIDKKGRTEKQFLIASSSVDISGFEKNFL